MESAAGPVSGQRPVSSPGGYKGSGRSCAIWSAVPAAWKLAVASAARLSLPKLRMFLTVLLL